MYCLHAHTTHNTHNLPAHIHVHVHTHIHIHIRTNTYNIHTQTRTHLKHAQTHKRTQYTHTNTHTFKSCTGESSITGDQAWSATEGRAGISIAGVFLEQGLKYLDEMCVSCDAKASGACRKLNCRCVFSARFGVF
jgi:hypothetical protein